MSSAVVIIRRYPPSCVLYVTNIAAGVEERELSSLFSEYGTVTMVNIIVKERPMAWVQYEVCSITDH